MIHTPRPRPMTRRDALCKMGAGFGMLSFASLIADTLAFGADSPATNPWMIQDPKFKPKAKHVIFLFMNGGMSQVDTFDPKPMLEKYDGKPLPGETPQHERKTGGLMKSPFTFKKYGKSGIEVSELFPIRGRVHRRYLRDPLGTHRDPKSRAGADHDEQRGERRRASVDGLVDYLRPGNRRTRILPSFVVLCPDVPTTVGPPLWNSAFLPPMYQGTYVTDDAHVEGLRSAEVDSEHSQRNVRPYAAEEGTGPGCGTGSVEYAVGQGCTIPNWRPRSRRSRRRTACRPRPPTYST